MGTIPLFVTVTIVITDAISIVYDEESIGNIASFSSD